MEKRTIPKLLLGNHPESYASGYGLVMELAYVSDSKSEFCGFESHPGHHCLSVAKKNRWLVSLSFRLVFVSLA